MNLRDAALTSSVMMDVDICATGSSNSTALALTRSPLVPALVYLYDNDERPSVCCFGSDPRARAWSAEL